MWTQPVPSGSSSLPTGHGWALQPRWWHLGEMDLRGKILHSRFQTRVGRTWKKQLCWDQSQWRRWGRRRFVCQSSYLFVSHKGPCQSRYPHCSPCRSHMSSRKLYPLESPCLSKSLAENGGHPHWSSLLLKDCTLWRGLMLQQFLKNYRCSSSVPHWSSHAGLHPLGEIPCWLKGRVQWRSSSSSVKEWP